MNARSYDHAIIPQEIRNNKNLHPGAKFLFAEIVAHTSDDGICNHSFVYFAELLSVSPSSIRRWMAQLINERVVSTSVEYTQNGALRIISVMFETTSMSYKLFETALVNYEECASVKSEQCSGESHQMILTDGIAESIAEKANSTSRVIILEILGSRSKKEELITPIGIGVKRVRVSPPDLGPERAPMVQISNEHYELECSEHGKEFVDSAIQLLSQWKLDKHAADPRWLKAHKATDIGRIKKWVYDSLRQKQFRSPSRPAVAPEQNIKMNQDLFLGLLNAPFVPDGLLVGDTSRIVLKGIGGDPRPLRVEDHGVGLQVESWMRKNGFTPKQIDQIKNYRKIIDQQIEIHATLEKTTSLHQFGNIFTISGDNFKFNIDGRSGQVHCRTLGYMPIVKKCLEFVQAPPKLMQLVA